MTGNETGIGMGGGASFEKTHWTNVFNAAHDPANTCARNALGRLYESYCTPLYCFVRRQGKKPEDAEDLVQGFFEHILEKNTIAAADPARGTFRSFLLKCLNNYITNERRKEKARKRHPGVPILSFDAPQAETHFGLTPADNESPDRIYERDCAWALVEQAVGRLRAKYKARGKGELFEALSPCLMGDALDESYQELANRFHKTETALREEASRMRKGLRKLLKEMLLPVTAKHGDLKAELRALLEALS